MNNRRSSKSAFTLIELLTVIAVIAVLAAILIPSIGAVRKNANQVKCASNMRSIAQAIIMYAAENGRYPSNNVSYDRSIMPYLGIDESAVADLPTGPLLRTDARNGAVAGIAELFRSPADDVPRSNPDFFLRSYAIVPWTCNWSNGTATRGFPGLPTNTGVPPVVNPNPSKAALLVQVHRPANAIGSPGNALGDGPASTADNRIHGDKSNVAFADGHVASFNYKEISPNNFIGEYWGGAGMFQNN
ncbi:MAG: prepilin-type N-terminal cleavage/methylation domain-containing protein [Puniceicoccaceae bacterium]|nr:MAG: prepilin-type N-terminal cleavage/methylation domain-containing protein [Puniceicoccaceae bacterium]